MGDRANIFIRDQYESPDRQAGVWLYTHWCGYDVAARLRRALALRERWNDAAYLARIVFQSMVDRDDVTTGFGISAAPGDNERPVLVLDCNAQLLSACDLSRNDERRLGQPLRSMTLAQFVALDDAGARRFHLGYDESDGDDDESGAHCPARPQVRADDARSVLGGILFDEHDPPQPRIRAVVGAALEAALALDYDPVATEEILREAVIFAARQLGVRSILG